MGVMRGSQYKVKVVRLSYSAGYWCHRGVLVPRNMHTLLCAHQRLSPMLSLTSGWGGVTEQAGAGEEETDGQA